MRKFELNRVILKNIKTKEQNTLGINLNDNAIIQLIDKFVQKHNLKEVVFKDTGKDIFIDLSPSDELLIVRHIND